MEELLEATTLPSGYAVSTPERISLMIACYSRRLQGRNRSQCYDMNK